MVRLSMELEVPTIGLHTLISQKKKKCNDHTFDLDTKLTYGLTLTCKYNESSVFKISKL